MSVFPQKITRPTKSGKEKRGERRGGKEEEEKRGLKETSNRETKLGYNICT
jgi:hypothetical protein